MKGHIRLGYKMVVSDATFTRAVDKTEEVAEKVIEQKVRENDEVKEVVAQIAEVVERQYEPGKKIDWKAVMDEVGKGEIKAAKEAVKKDIIDGAIEAGEKVTGKKAKRWKKLLRIFVKKALPMGVFGFIDNVILVLVGETLDATIAQTMGFSSMASAGIGNAISDAVGVLGQDTVDRALEKIGLGGENDDGEEGFAEKVVGKTGGSIGIIVGCLIGMFPLLFMRGGSVDEEEDRIMRIARRIERNVHTGS